MLARSYHSQVYTQLRPATLAGMLRMAITDRRLGAPAGESAAERNHRVAERAAILAVQGLDYLLIREKDLAAGELVGLCRMVVKAVRAANRHTKILVAGRADVALAVGANGVHLGAAPGELTPAQVRVVMPGAFVSVSCHELEEVERARTLEASLILFAPVFAKTVAGQQVVAGVGLEALRQACRLAGDVPVFALGGVTETNAEQCILAGAAGVAAIRMFFGSQG